MSERNILTQYKVSHQGCDVEVTCGNCLLGEIYFPVKEGKVPEKLEISDAENWYKYILVKVSPIVTGR